MPTLITAIALLSTSSALVAPNDTFKLEYTFDTKGPITYVITQSQSITQDIMGEVSQSTESGALFVHRELIATQDDGTLVVSQRSKAYSFTENLMDENFEFDSTNPAHDPLKSDYRVATQVESFGWNIEILMSPQGDVVGLNNADEISDLIEKVSDSENQEELTDMFSLQTLTGDYGPFWHVLPEQAVGLGDVWERVYTIEDEDFGFIIDQTMTVKQITKTKGGQTLHVDIEGTINVDEAMLSEFPPFMKVTKNTYSGNFIFNTALGTVTNFESTISLDIAGSPGEGMGDVIISSDMKLQYKMIEN